ncbi:hypothetical protein, partial [Thauera phenolivorans]|uniref:hypothetical protein n=1 Tax=Thauera phenolivorans TaxID=1792543 RepID=UPI001E394F29
TAVAGCKSVSLGVFVRVVGGMRPPGFGGLHLFILSVDLSRLCARDRSAHRCWRPMRRWR